MTVIDFAAISGLGVGALALVGTLYGSRKGASASDRDNRFQVLSETVDQLQEQVKACEQREQRAQERYRQQDADMDELRRRHHDLLDKYETGQDELHSVHNEVRALRREVDTYRSQKGQEP